MEKTQGLSRYQLLDEKSARKFHLEEMKNGVNVSGTATCDENGETYNLDEGRIEKFIAQSKNKEYLQIWKRNGQLIDLFWLVRHNPLATLPIKSKKKFKYEKFKELCIEYSLASFLTNEFIKPFKALHHE